MKLTSRNTVRHYSIDDETPEAASKHLTSNLGSLNWTGRQRTLFQNV